MTYLLGTIVFGFLLKIAYLDYKYRYIADRDILLASAATLAFQYGRGALGDALGGLFFCALCALCVYAAARFKYKYSAFGSGDVTLFIFLGSLVGRKALASWAVFTSLLFLATLLSIYKVLNVSPQKAIPLAPILNISVLLWKIGENLRIFPLNCANFVNFVNFFQHPL